MTDPAPVGTLLVDVRPVDHPTARDRGIGRYTAGLLGGLHRVGAPVVGMYAGDVDADRARQAAPGVELRPWSPGAVREHAGPASWYLATQLMLHPVSLDPIPSAVTAAGLPVAAVMYDVIPFRNPAHYLRDPNARALASIRAALARTVDAMLAISQFSLETAAEELDFPAARMRVIGAGVDAPFVPARVDARPWPARFAGLDDRRIVVAVTGGDERKNTEGLLRAWSLLDPTVAESARLVVATGAAAPVLGRWRAVAAELGVLDDVVFTGRVSDDEMVALLQHGALAILPSFEEGFGLPVLEAAACGCPAICSGTSSLPEVLAEPAAWFDPADPAAIARAVERGLVDEAHRARLADAGRRAVERFTWERAAAATMDALAVLGRRWTPVGRRPRRRLAIARPQDGGPTGGAELVPALRRAPHEVRVDEFVDPTGGATPLAAGTTPVGALGRYAKPWDFDDVVVVGVPGHRGVSRLAAAVPCHVWAGAADRADLPDAVLDRARSVVVGSDDAARALRTRRPGGPPIAVVPPPAGDEPAGSVDEAAASLLAWLDDVGELEAGTIRRLRPPPR